MSSEVCVFIALGSNLGDRHDNIRKALDFLKAVPGIFIEQISVLRETKPQGGPLQPDYINGVIKIKSALSPQALLAVLQNIEMKMGRIRTVKNGPRVIDLDILLYGCQIIDEPGLSIPHPRMRERDFVMQPLLEIEPDIIKILDRLARDKT